MAKTQTKKLSQQELDEAFYRTKEEIKELIPPLFTKECFFPFLDFLLKWQHYSIYNVLLLYKQFPQATYLASYKRWKELSYLSGKGEYHTILKSSAKKKGITFLIPFSLYRITSGPKERFLSYHPIYVFDASQVNDIPYPKPFSAYVPIKELAFYDFLSLLRTTEKGNLLFLPLKKDKDETIMKDAYLLKDTIFFNPYSSEKKESLFRAYICYVTRNICEHKNFDAATLNFITRAATKSLLSFYELRQASFSYEDTKLLYDIEDLSNKDRDFLLMILHYLQLVIKSCIFSIQLGFSVHLATNCDKFSEPDLKSILSKKENKDLTHI